MLMAGSKAGRPKKSGPRFPSGDLIRTEDLPATLAWQRIREHTFKDARQSALGTFAGRMYLDGKFTTDEWSALNEIGSLYAAFHRFEGLTAHPHSPGFEAGRGGADTDAVEAIGNEIALRLSDARRLPRSAVRDRLIGWLEDHRAMLSKERTRAKSRWARLNECFASGRVPENIYRLAVLDQMPPLYELAEIKRSLNIVCYKLNLHKSAGSLRRVH
jgi:hypothetical protein